jgi:inhibitor of KinA sporulation pathway (predicted exonuclease)
VVELNAALRLDGTVVVFDLEWTAWEGAMARDWQGPGEEMEVVQIGAVKLDGARGLIETDGFETLVRPRINPVLSDYFTALTGITQAMVDAEGVEFPAALAAFGAFIGNHTAAVLSFGRDPAVLAANCRLNRMPFPFEPGLFTNVIGALRSALEIAGAAFSSSDLPRLMDFPPPGTAHQAIGDARCIAEALRRLHARGAL